MFGEVAERAQGLDVADVTRATLPDGNHVVSVQSNHWLCKAAAQAAMVILSLERFPFRIRELTTGSCLERPSIGCIGAPLRFIGLPPRCLYLAVMLLRQQSMYLLLQAGLRRLFPGALSIRMRLVLSVAAVVFALVVWMGFMEASQVLARLLFVGIAVFAMLDLDAILVAFVCRVAAGTAKRIVAVRRGSVPIEVGQWQIAFAADAVFHGNIIAQKKGG